MAQNLTQKAAPTHKIQPSSSEESAPSFSSIPPSSSSNDESYNISTPEMEHEAMTPPTGKLINLQLSQLCAMMHSKSEEDQPGPNRQPEHQELQKLKVDLEITLKDMISHEHHKEFMVLALKSNNPPPPSPHAKTKPDGERPNKRPHNKGRQYSKRNWLTNSQLIT